ncbi:MULTISPECIES: glycosyltransferase [Brevibacterium]|uniref:Glycosyltransferase 2-like domain-containing protein n=1 Tax=Brevibacterium salitolerans TaxID=1403566 RepID=A0ABP5IFS2_9MICO|nr:glycosyltransferase [Brevibacterium sp.]
MNVSGSRLHAPLWTLITVTYNSADKLREYWGGFASDDTVEWIVVDNASTDGTADLARSFGAQVVRLEENRGFGAANNVGFAAARGEYVAFVNPDIAVDVATLPVLERLLGDRHLLVSPQLVNDDGSRQPNGRGWPYLTDKVLNRLAPAKVQGRYRLFAGDAQELTPVVWLTGAAVAGRKETFSRLDGPWDDHFFLYYEDTDLALRARRAGIPSAVTSRVVWTHGWARETAGRFRLAPWRREIASLLKFYARYPYLLGPALHPRSKRGTFG